MRGSTPFDGVAMTAHAPGRRLLMHRDIQAPRRRYYAVRSSVDRSIALPTLAR